MVAEKALSLATLLASPLFLAASLGALKAWLFRGVYKRLLAYVIEQVVHLVVFFHPSITNARLKQLRLRLKAFLMNEFRKRPKIVVVPILFVLSGATGVLVWAAYLLLEMWHLFEHVWVFAHDSTAKFFVGTVFQKTSQRARVFRAKKYVFLHRHASHWRGKYRTWVRFRLIRLVHAFRRWHRSHFLKK